MKDRIKKLLVKKIIVISLITVLVFSTVSFIASKIIYDNQFPSHPTPDWNVFAGINFQYSDQTHPKVEVEFLSGDNKLKGYIFGQENDKGLIVVSHGLGGGAQSYLAQITYFVDNGWRVFAFDNTGSHESEGKTTKGFPQSVVDLDAALSYVESNNDLNGLDIMLFGHSWGGYAVLNVLNFEAHDIKGIVSVSGPNSAIDFINGQVNDMMGIFGFTQHPFLSLYQRLLYGKVASFTAVEGLNKSDVCAFVIHGENDLVVRKEYSAYSRKDEIENPKVQFLLRGNEGDSGHNNIFKSQASLEYLEEINKLYRKLYEDYNQDIPYEVKVQFYSQLDDYLVSEIDHELMNTILEFYEECLSG